MNRNTDYRPHSEGQFLTALSNKIPLWTHCAECGQPFSNDNTHSPEGWRDTQIVGWCEDCYNKTFEDS